MRFLNCIHCSTSCNVCWEDEDEEYWLMWHRVVWCKGTNAAQERAASMCGHSSYLQSREPRTWKWLQTIERWRTRRQSVVTHLKVTLQHSPQSLRKNINTSQVSRPSGWESNSTPFAHGKTKRRPQESFHRRKKKVTLPSRCTPSCSWCATGEHAMWSCCRWEKFLPTICSNVSHQNSLVFHASFISWSNNLCCSAITFSLGGGGGSRNTFK